MPQDMNFGIDNEFTATPSLVETPIPPKVDGKKFRREIDLKDGSGVQVFEADTMDLLVDELAKAQENATRKIRELASGKRRPKIDKTAPNPVLQFQPKQLSAVEQQQLAEKQQTDPVGAFNDMFTAIVGVTPQQFVGNQTKQQELLQARSVQEAEAEFLANHDDYEPTPKNAKMIYEFLGEQELPTTVNNLEYAYQELIDAGRIKLTSMTTQTAQPTPVPAPEPVTIRSTPPTVLSSRSSANAPEYESGQGVDVAELSRLPLDQAKERIVSMMRQARSRPA